MCDGCYPESHEGPASRIKGIRYKCSVRADFDLCEDCEAKNTHEYPMLKIRNPAQAVNRVKCEFQPRAHAFPIMKIFKAFLNKDEEVLNQKEEA